MIVHHELMAIIGVSEILVRLYYLIAWAVSQFSVATLVVLLPPRVSMIGSVHNVCTSPAKNNMIAL